MTKRVKLSDAELKQRQTVNLVHGGAGALRRVQEGREFVGIAAQAELDVYSELETQGRVSIIRRNAARLQAVTDLFWNAVQMAAQDGNLDLLDHYVARFGWLSGASLRAWLVLKAEEERPGSPVDVQTVLDAVRKGADDEN